MNAVLKEDINSIIANKTINWDALKDASFLVTGATGLIGSLLIRTLAEYKQQSNSEMRLYACFRSEDRAKAILGDAYSSVIPVIGDIREEIMPAGSMDYIIHCASVTTSAEMIAYPAETMDIAISGTKRVLEYARHADIRKMIYVSSMEIYGQTQETDNPITEDKLGYVDLSEARSCYPEGKRVCELMCNVYYREYGVPVVSARLAQTLGPGLPSRDSRLPMIMARNVIAGEDIVLHTAGKSVSNFCYTADMVRALLLLLVEGADGEAYNVCNDSESRTIFEIATLVAEEVAQGNIGVRTVIPKGSSFGYAHDTSAKLLSEKLKKLGWKPETDMVSGYKRLVEYIKSGDNQ